MDLLQHLKDRHLNVDLHRPCISQDDGTVTFFLYNLSGQMVGYQQYRPDKSKLENNHPKEGRYFTYRTPGSIAVFGLESLDLKQDIVFVTEGIFDAARLTSRGVPALAVLSNDPPQDIRNFLHSLGRTVVAVCDRDAAGRKLAKLGHHAVFTDDKDLGDSDDAFVDALIDRFRGYP